MCVRTLCAALFCWFFGTVAVGNFCNPGFEIPDPSRATQWFTPPMDWEWSDTTDNLNYVGLHDDFTPEPEQGQPVTWSITAPVSGNYFVLLSTGDAQGKRSYTKTAFSSIQQPVTICSGDVISGNYFFGTCDYIPYNDTGLVKLIPVDPNDGLRSIVLVHISVQDLGNYQSTNGWQHFQYRFEGENECGKYILYCEVRDYIDRIYKSYLALDNFRICKGLPSFGDLNSDCQIDYYDFDILSQAWLADCNDPNVANDPNIPCDLIVTDPNTIGGYIELDHVMKLSEHWLENYSR